MENNNSQEFNMDKYNDFLSKIKAGSPVHKINFTLENPNAVVGMYLITMEDAQSYIDKAADYNDLKDNTLLVFESRHVIECCQIIYGCLNILKSIGMYRIDYETFINEVIDTLLTRPSFYKNIIKELATLTHNLINIDNSDATALIYKKFLHIIKNIWFVPYGKIDEMANDALDEFEQHYKVGENNE